MLGGNNNAKKVEHRGHIWKPIAVSLIIMILLLLVLLPLASTYPDGLERVAQDLGLTGSQPLWSGLFPDYAAPVGGSWLGTFLAGIIGAIVVLASMLLIAKIVSLRAKK